MTLRHLALPALVLLAVLGCSGSGEQNAVTPGVGKESVEAARDEAETKSNEPLRTAAVEIYFPSANRDGLIGEFREIFATATPGDRAKQIISDLISGPTTRACLRAVPASSR